MQPKKKMSKKKKIVIALLIIFSPIILLILILIYGFATDPIYDYFDHQKFITLDQDAQQIHQELVAVATTDEKWEYKTACADEHTGPWPTGNFDCITMSILTKNVSTNQEIQAMHEKYFPIIDTHEGLVFSDPLSNDGIFQEKFVVNSMIKLYEFKDEKTICSYVVQLTQIQDDLDYNLYKKNQPIIEAGKATISLICRNIAQESWYPKVRDVSGVPPELEPAL